jgi:hypothetical protein
MPGISLGIFFVCDAGLGLDMSWCGVVSLPLVMSDETPTTESVRLDRQLVERVRVIAKAEGRWLSKMLQILIEEALAQRAYIKEFAARKLKKR